MGFSNKKTINTASWHGNIFRSTGTLAGNSPVTGRFPSQGPAMKNVDVFFSYQTEQTVEQTVEVPIIWDTMTTIWRHFDISGNPRCTCHHYPVLCLSSLACCMEIPPGCRTGWCPWHADVCIGVNTQTLIGTHKVYTCIQSWAFIYVLILFIAT